MALPITSIYTALFAIMMVPLSLSVSMHYLKTGTSQATPDVLKNDETLRRKTRAHGNFIEYVPTALILLGLLELSAANPIVLWVGGGAFVFARIIHAIGQLYTDTPALRAMGMIIGHFYFLLGAMYLIVLNM